MTKWLVPPPVDYAPRIPDARELVRYVVDRVIEARENGGPIYPLLVVGDQGVGKSRLLAAIAVELRRAGLDVFYDIALPKPRETPWDYIILDDLGALVTSWEWQTKAGRLLKKIEILIRNLGRWGYAVAAPRATDVIKNFREKAHLLLLVARAELKHEYGVDTACDVIAIYAKYVAAAEYMLYQHMYITPIKGRRYCIKWGDFPWYNDAEWRSEYKHVQAKRNELIARWVGELGEALTKEDETLLKDIDVIRTAVQRAREELARCDGDYDIVTPEDKECRCGRVYLYKLARRGLSGTTIEYVRQLLARLGIDADAEVVWDAKLRRSYIKICTRPV